MTIRDQIISVKVKCRNCNRISDVPFEDFEINPDRYVGVKYEFLCQHSDCDNHNIVTEEI